MTLGGLLFGVQNTEEGLRKYQKRGVSVLDLQLTVDYRVLPSGPPEPVIYLEAQEIERKSGYPAWFQDDLLSGPGSTRNTNRKKRWSSSLWRPTASTGSGSPRRWEEGR